MQRDITAELVIASDIHLRDQHDERGALLLQTLARIDPTQVRCFVLLGDIFDFCFGGSAYFRTKYAALGQALSRLAAAGTRVVFVQGNHEFALGHLAWPGVEFISKRELVTTLSNGERLALSHGDRLAAPWHYHIYSRITRSWLFCTLARFVPQAWLDDLALGLSMRSRQRDQYRRLDHRRVLGALEGWLATTGCRYGVVGHFHVPYDVSCSHDPLSRLLCLKSWDEPNLLTFDGTEFTRLSLTPSALSGTP